MTSFHSLATFLFGTRRALAIAAGATLFCMANAGAVTLDWTRGATDAQIPTQSFPGCGNNVPGKRAIARDGAGNVFVTGCVNTGNDYDFLTIKYNGSSGVEMWRAVSDGTAHGDDTGLALALDGSGNVVVTGQSMNASGNNDYLTIKYDGASGAELWRTASDGAAHGNDTVGAVGVDGSGNVIVTGYADNGLGNTDYLTIKYNGTTGSELWRTMSDGAGFSDDQAYAMAVDASGNVVVTGYTTNAIASYDFLTIKYNGTNGNEMWRAVGDGVAHNFDQAYAVALDSGGNVVVTGYSVNAAFNNDFLTIKYNGSTGAELWRAASDGTAHNYDQAYAVAVDGSDNVVVTGYSANAAGNYDFLTIKYNGATGGETWRAVGDGTAHGNDFAYSLVVDGSNNVVVTGYSANAAGNNDFLTIKYAAANGAEMWRALGDGAAHGNDVALALVLDASGNAVVAGYSHNANNLDDFLVVKYDAAAGGELWRRVSVALQYAPSGLGEFVRGAMAVDGSGNVVVAGRTKNATGNFDYVTIKYDRASGAPLWQTISDGVAHLNDLPSAIALDGSGNVLVTGQSRNAITTDFLTIKYDGTTGAELWRAVGNGAPNRDDAAVALAVDGSGNVAVTGYSYNALNKADYLTIKYNGANGNELWRVVGDGAAHLDDVPLAIAVDGSNNFVVTGQSNNAAGKADYLTIKYSGTTGGELWRAVGDGAAHGDDFASDLAIDTSNNVLVTGQSQGAGSVSDFLTIKYNGTTGAELWRAVSDGVAHGDDAANSIALDSSGNAFVTGSSVNGNGNTDFMTVKLAAATGSELWRAVADGVALGDDQALALAVDGSGNVAVTGQSNNAGGNADFLTVKYDHATGAELWRFVYAGTGNGDDTSFAIAKNPTGFYVGGNSVQAGRPSQIRVLKLIDTSIDATLSGLTVSSGALVPVFESGTLAYTDAVANTVTSITVTPTASDPLATITVNGVTVASGNASGPISLSVGSNPVTVQVTAQDGITVKTYTIAVTRPTSSNANLSTLTVSSGTLTPAFASGTLAYTDAVASSVTSITVTPTVADATATIKVNTVTVASGNASAPISLNVGSNPITVAVTAQDGTTVKTYTIAVTRAPSSNANLSALTISSGTLTPAFASGTLAYTDAVANNVTSVTVTPTVADATATITVNSVAVASGNASGAISLNVGSNPVTVQVTAQDGTTVKTYTIAVTRAASSNANLSALTISSGTLTPAFASGTLAYTDAVANSVTSITVTPTVADATATITVNGVPVASGNASGAIALSVGSNPVTVAVTAQDGTTVKTYTIAVNRAPSTNANLSALTVSSGTLVPAFASGTLAYSDAVANNVTSITVTPTAADAAATITVNAVVVASGNASAPISLNVGSNSVTVQVTAQDGTTVKTYTIAVNRAGSSNADLSNLTLSNGTLTPAFASGTLAYTAGVASNNNTITVTPTLSDPAATVTVNGVGVASGSPSGPITLSIGSNPVTVVVTAVDLSTKTYTVDVTYRLPSSCTYSVSPLDLPNFATAGGPASITVTTPAGCPVTVTSYQPWVTVNSITPSGGTTIVSLQIGAGAGRATSIVVVDRLFLITQ